MAERETVASEGEVCHKPCEWGRAYIGHRAEDRSESECLGVALRIGSTTRKGHESGVNYTGPGAEKSDQ